MSTAARSHNFIKTGIITTGAITDYVVPSGKVAAVTGMTVAKTTANAPVSVYAGMFAPGDATITYLWMAQFVSTTVIEASFWNSRAVLAAGWTLRMARFSAAGNFSAQASGFLYDA